jgi:hypothetical protein
MDNQAAFKKSALHILAQRRICEAKDADGAKVCMYAGPNGQACAVGCLLPRRVAEKLDAAGLTRWFDVLNSGPKGHEAIRHLRGVNPLLLGKLQAIHDNGVVVSKRSTGRSREDKLHLRRLLIELGREMRLDTRFLEV